MDPIVFWKFSTELFESECIQSGVSAPSPIAICDATETLQIWAQTE